jgi:hypothetical protein
LGYKPIAFQASSKIIFDNIKILTALLSKGRYSLQRAEFMTPLLFYTSINLAYLLDVSSDRKLASALRQITPKSPVTGATNNT